MKKIYLFPKDPLPRAILAMLDIDKIDRIGKWLAALPPTKRGSLAYRMTSGIGGGKVPAVVFVRRDDAIAFRLKFGL
jgi:hypothetical protein